MVLEGEMLLEHEGHHSKLLRAYEQDSYSGGWTTQSTGKVHDFNLMLAEGCKGTLEAIHIPAGKSHVISSAALAAEYHHSSEAFYCVEGAVTVTLNEESAELGAGDFLLIDFLKAGEQLHLELTNRDNTAATIIRAVMHK